MDNSTLARLLDETAALLEIDGADPFRIRSYRRAAEAVEAQTTQLETLTLPDADPKALLAIPTIGSAMPQTVGIRDGRNTTRQPGQGESPYRRLSLPGCLSQRPVLVALA